MGQSQPYHLFTTTVHAGMPPDDGTPGPSVPPLSPSVGFTYPTMEQTSDALGYAGGPDGQGEQYVYGRHGGPTHTILEDALASLEGTARALTFSSGMAALHAAFLAVAGPAGIILAAQEIYGVTRTLLDWLDAYTEIEVQYTAFLDTAGTVARIEQLKPTVVFCETLTNPLVRVVALGYIVEVAKAVGSTVIVDNTFATPYLLRPIELGADVVVHSTTKYLNGHGDVTGGALAAGDEIVGAAFGYRKLLGATPSPFDAWLTLRGLRTFAVRMRQHCENALTVADWLAKNPLIERVYYPGLPLDPDHLTAAQLFETRGFGGMIAFDTVFAGRDEVFRLVERLTLIRPVTSLGDVFSLILHPATSSHRALTPQARAALGIHEGTLRLSVGIEAAEDIITDLDQALTGISS